MFHDVLQNEPTAMIGKREFFPKSMSTTHFHIYSVPKSTETIAETEAETMIVKNVNNNCDDDEQIGKRFNQNKSLKKVLFYHDIIF